MELEQIQELLNDAMEMAQDADLIPPHIDTTDVDAVASILSDWVMQLETKDGSETTSREIIVSAIACAFLAGRLTNVEVNDLTNPTHRSENGNTYYIYNYFG